MRRTGKTTRLIDSAVDMLFTKGKLLLSLDADFSDLVDYDYEIDNLAQKDFIERLIRRLHSEHNNSFKIKERGTFIEITVK